MKFCLFLLLLLLLFDSPQGSSLPHIRKIRALNTTLQTNFNGTYERRNPCTNAEIETSSYIASHEFHHHTKEDNWSDYTHKCSAIISGFLQAIGNLVRFNNKQNGIFNFHINTSISQKQDGYHEPGKVCNSMPTIIIEATDCQITPRAHENLENAERLNERKRKEKSEGFTCQNEGNEAVAPGLASHRQQKPAKIVSDRPILNFEQKILQSQKAEEKLKKGEADTSMTDPEADATAYPFVPLLSNTPGEILPTADPSLAVSSEFSEDPLSYDTIPDIFGPSTTLLTDSEDVTSAPEFTPDYENVPISCRPSQPMSDDAEDQSKALENFNEGSNFNPPTRIPNMPYYTTQPSVTGCGTTSQPTVPVSNVERINQNQYPPALVNEQEPPVVYSKQLSNDNLSGQVPDSLLGRELPNSSPYPNSKLLLPLERVKPFEGNPRMEGALGYPKISPATFPVNSYGTKIISNEFAPPGEPLPFSNAPPGTQMPEPFLLQDKQIDTNQYKTTLYPPPTFRPDQTGLAGIPIKVPPQLSPNVRKTFGDDGKTSTLEISMTYPPPPTPPRDYNETPVLLEGTPAPGQFFDTRPKFDNNLRTDEQQNIAPTPVQSLQLEPVTNSDRLPTSAIGKQINDMPPSGQELSTESNQFPISLAPEFQQQQTVTTQYQPSVESDRQYGRGKVDSQITDIVPATSSSNQLIPNTFIQPGPGSAGNIPPSPEQPFGFYAPQQPRPPTVPLEATPPQQIPNLQPSLGSARQFSNVEVSRSPSENFKEIGPFGPDFQNVAPFQVPNLGPVSSQPAGAIPPALENYATQPVPFVPESEKIASNEAPMLRNVEEVSSEVIPPPYENDSNLVVQPFVNPGATLSPGFTTPPIFPSIPSESSVISTKISNVVSEELSPQTFTTPIPSYDNLSPSQPEVFNPRDRPQENPQPELTPSPLLDLTKVQPAPFPNGKQQGSFLGRPFPPYPQNSRQPIRPIYEVPIANRPFNGPIYYPEKNIPNGEFYPQKENQPFFAPQAGPQIPENLTPEQSPQNIAPPNDKQTGIQPILENQTPNILAPSPESPVPFLTPEAASPQESGPNTLSEIDGGEITKYRPSIVPVGSEQAPDFEMGGLISNGYPTIEQQRVGSQEVQPNYPNSGFPIEQKLPVDFLTTGAPISPKTESLINEMDNLTLDADVPAESGQPELQNLKTYNQFPATVPPQFTTQSIGEAVTPNVDYPKPYRPQPSENYNVEVFRAQTPMQTSVDGYQNPMPPSDERISYTQENLEIATESSPTSPVNQILIPPQHQFQKNPAVYSPPPVPQPQPQPSFDNLAEIPGGTLSGPQTSLPSELKPVPFAAQFPPETTYTDTTVQDTISTKTLDAQPKYGNLNYFPTPQFPQPNPELSDVNNFGKIQSSNTSPQIFSASQINVQENPALNYEQPLTRNLEEMSIQNHTITEEMVRIPPRRTQSLPEMNYPNQLKNYNLLPPNQLPPNFYSRGPQTLNFPNGQPDYGRHQQFLPTNTYPPLGQTYDSNLRQIPPNSFPRSAPRLEPPMQPLPQGSLPPFSNPNAREILSDSQIRQDSFIEPPLKQPSQGPQPTLTDTNTREIKTDTILSSTPGFQPTVQQSPQGPLPPFSNTVGMDVISDSLVPQDSAFGRSIQPPQVQVPPLSNTNIQEIVTDSVVSPPPVLESPLQQTSQDQQSFPDIDNREIVNQSLLNPDPVFDGPMNLPQGQLQPKFTNTPEIGAGTPISPITDFQPSIQQPPRGPFPPVTNMNNAEVTSDTLVSPPLVFEPPIQQVPPSPLLPFSNTNSKEILSDSLVRQGPIFEDQMQQPEAVPPFSNANTQEIVSDSLVIPPPGQVPPMQQFPESQEQASPNTNNREIMTDALESPPPVFEAPVQQPPQGPLPASSNTNFREITDVSDIITDPGRNPVPVPVPPMQQSPQALPPFLNTNNRNIMTDTLVSLPPFLQPPIQQPPQGQLPPFASNKEAESESLVSPAPDFELPPQQIPQGQQSPFPSTINRGIMTDTDVSPRPALETPIQQPPQVLPPFSNTNPQEIVIDNLVSPPPGPLSPIEQLPQGQEQAFPNTDNSEIVTESLVSPPPVFEAPVQQPPSSNTNFREITDVTDIMTNPVRNPVPVVVPPMQQSPEGLRSFSNTNVQEIISDSLVTPPPGFPVPMRQSPQVPLPPFTSTNGREVLSDSLVKQDSTIEPPMQQLPQDLFPLVPDMNGTEIISDTLPRRPPVFEPTLQQPIQGPLQPFGNTKSRGVTDVTEIITDSLPRPAPAFQPPMQQSPEGLPPFPNRNRPEMVTDTFVNPPPGFVSPIESPQTLLPDKNNRELLTDTTVSLPPVSDASLQQTTQSELLPFPITNTRETGVESLGYPAPGFLPAIEQLPQGQQPPFPVTNNREIIANTLISPPQPVEFSMNQPPQDQLSPFNNINAQEIKNDTPVSFVTDFQPPIQQPSESSLPPFSGSDTKETVMQSLVTSAPVFELPMQNTPYGPPTPVSEALPREIITDSSLTPTSPSPVFEPQMQTQLQGSPSPFANTKTAPPQGTPPFPTRNIQEAVTDTLISPAPGFLPPIQQSLQDTFPPVPRMNNREIISDTLSSPQPFLETTLQQPSQALTPFSVTNVQGIGTDILITPPPEGPQTPILQLPQAQQPPFPDINAKEIVTDISVTPPPVSEAPVQQPPQNSLPASSNLNIRQVTEVTDIKTDPVHSPAPVPLLPVSQLPQDLPPFLPTNAQEIVSDSFDSTPPGLLPPVQPPQGSFPPLSDGNGREIIFDIPPSNPQVLEPAVQQPQSLLPPPSNTNIREVTDITDIMTDTIRSSAPVLPPPVSQSPRDLPPFLPTNAQEIVSDSFDSPPPGLLPPVQPPQGPFPRVSDMKNGEIISNTPPSPPQVFKPAVQQPQGLFPLPSNTNIREVTDITDFAEDSIRSPAAILVPPMSQSPQGLPPFSNTNTQEVVSENILSPGSRVQPPIQQLSQEPDTNTRGIVTDTFISSAPGFQPPMPSLPSQGPSPPISDENAGEVVVAESVAPPLPVFDDGTEFANPAVQAEGKAFETFSNEALNISPGRKITELVEETFTTDLPLAVTFSPIEEQLALADKLLNQSLPVTESSIVTTVSPGGIEIGFDLPVELKSPFDQILSYDAENVPEEQYLGPKATRDYTLKSVAGSIPVRPEFEQGPLYRPALNDYNQVLSTPTPEERFPKYDEVVPPNVNGQTDRRPFDGPYDSRPRPANPPEMGASAGYSENGPFDFPPEQPNIPPQEHSNPLLQTLETHLTFPLHEPPEPMTSSPGPRRMSPLPLLPGSSTPADSKGDTIAVSVPTYPGRWDSQPNFVNSQSSQPNAGVDTAREVMISPQPDSRVLVSDTSDPSNGPDRTTTGRFSYMPRPLRNHSDRMRSVSTLEKF